MVQTRQGVRSTKHLLLENPETKAAVSDEQQEEKLHKSRGHHKTNYTYVQYK